MLRVTHLSKSYPTPGGTLPILTDVSFALDAGEAAAVTGPSGSGKSTLLYILGALEPPTSGEVTVDGRNPFTLTARELAEFRNAEIGFVFQDHSLLPQCSVLENVLVPTLVARGAGNETPQAYRERALALLDAVGLAHRLEHRPAALSGGEKQRVAIARALIRRPKLLLCDEPTGNLDQHTADVVAALLLDLHRAQRNVLIAVTHSERLARGFPVRFEIGDGRIARA